MKTKDLSQLSNAELLKKHKQLKMLVGFFWGVGLAAIAAVVYLNIVKKRFSPGTIAIITLIPAMISNSKQIKNIEEELKRRQL